MDNNSLAAMIGHCCTWALVDEVSATPKPGLVDRNNSGAHRDMGFDTFMDSIDAVSPAFTLFAQAGMSMGVLDESSLSLIRPIGVRCEKAMLDATGGINTHKGAIFSLGIIAAAAGHCAVNADNMSADTICDVAAIIAKSAQQDFDRPLPKGEPMTKGCELYIKYGMRGIRGEAADGFPSVRAALPELRQLMNSGAHVTNAIHLQALLRLMGTVDDTNVAARCGPDAVQLMHTDAKQILAAGGAIATHGMLMLYALDHSYIGKNISPGGCADLLSVTLALYRLEQLGAKTEEDSNGQ